MSTFAISTLKVEDSGQESYLFLGIHNFGILILDLNDYSKHQFIDVLKKIDWVDPLP